MESGHDHHQPLWILGILIINPYDLTGQRGRSTGARVSLALDAPRGIAEAGLYLKVGNGHAPENVCSKTCLHIYGPRICAMCILCYPQVWYTHFVSYQMRSERRGVSEPSATGLDSEY